MSGVDGADKLRALGDRLRTENKRLLPRMRRSMEKGMAPLSDLIRAASPNYMPDGYEATFASSLRFRTSVRTSGKNAAVELITFAQGRSKRRRVRQYDKGTLRHKTWGRPPWHRQHIVRGFWSEPVAAQREVITAAMEQVMLDTAIAIMKGK